jgi:hypothetical protein
MNDTLTRYLESVQSATTRENLRVPLEAIVDRLSSQATSTAGLVIKSGGSTLAKTGSTAFAGVANGVPVAIAASTDMPALVGTIAAGSYGIFCFFIDSASTVTVALGATGTTLAKAKFPPFPKQKCLVGYLVVTYASTFTGGTTALDTATTVYVSPVGAFDPTVLI